MDNKIFCVKGNYTLRQIAGEYLAIPINNEAGEDANIVILNPVSQIIWNKLETGSTFDEILDAVMKEFNVEKEEATTDIKEFLAGLEQANLLK